MWPSAMAKYIGDCRLTHYSALLRKALDDAGFAQVPILTNDDQDSHHLHPGFHMNLLSAVAHCLRPAHDRRPGGTAAEDPPL